MKPLAKSLKEANRYILIRIEGPNFSFTEFEKALFIHLTKWIGQFRIGKYDISVLKNQYKSPFAVILTNPKGLKEVRAALELIETLDGQKTTVNTILTSGTLVKIKAKLKDL